METITVWSDVTCPWASLALHVLHNAAAERGVQVRIDHRVFPLELVNREPTPKVGHDEEVEAIRAVVPDVGWSPWSSPDWTYPVTALPAMEAVQAAKAQGLEAADELDSALRRGFFAEHRCISLHPVIADIAASCDHVDADALMESLHTGAGRQQVYSDLDLATGDAVKGSPHFWTSEGSYAANPGVDDPKDFRRYDASWVDGLL